MKSKIIFLVVILMIVLASSGCIETISNLSILILRGRTLKSTRKATQIMQEEIDNLKA